MQGKIISIIKLYAKSDSVKLIFFRVNVPVQLKLAFLNGYAGGNEVNVDIQE